MDWPEAAQKGALLAGGINVVLLAVVLATRRWWGWGKSATAASEDSVPCGATPVSSPRWFWPALLGILVLAGGLRWDLAHSSLWWDEVWQTRNAALGEWRPDKKNPGTFRFRETSVAQALWNYRKPTNHPPMALASKASHAVWSKLSGAKPGTLHEFALRFPGFVASLGGLALLALLLRAWGLPGAGLAAAFFLAVHPFHVRYGIDCRGYTFLLPLTVAGLWALWRACGPGRPFAEQGLAGRGSPRTAWLLFGLCQALIMWCHLLSAWVCLALCAAGAAWLWRGKNSGERTRGIARLLAAQLLGAMVFFQLFMPNLLQAAQWGDKNQDGQVLDLVLLKSMAAGLVDSPLEWTGVALLAALALLGLVSAQPRASWARWVFGLMIAACAVLWLALAGAEFFFYKRFLFAALVPLAGLMALGLSAFAPCAATHPPPFGKTGTVLGGVLLLLIAASFWPGLGFFQRTPFTPLRETAAILKNEQAQGARLFGYGFGAEALQYYLPGLEYDRGDNSANSLAQALAEAKAAGHPLCVAIGYEELNRAGLPEGFALLDNPATFAEISRLPGVEPQFTFRVLKSK